MLHLDDGTWTTVREWCVHSADVELEHRNQKWLYWGTIRHFAFARDAYWLNTGRGSAPTVVLQPDAMTALFERKKVDAAPSYTVVHGQVLQFTVVYCD